MGILASFFSPQILSCKTRDTMSRQSVIKNSMHISDTSGHRFRQYPDSVTGTSGQ
ncbi:hypothetical protein [Dehalobacter sp. TBBPA1]|uniref:hypothetical protein n=1 Tax=Dehalobacter sp. TBBPA1 TaxID=3235037 RepID=UPI0034A342DB